MTDDDSWAALKRPLPPWFQEASLGIFIHWGAYSVPAWAEPTAELGTVSDDRTWFTHNPYAEWYHNTIRIDGSPAQRHHREVYGGCPYDDFLDRWTAERFDADEMLALVEGAGADYVIPTTKHHDGIALWDAPGTGTRNTVHRGPRRDLVAEIRDAALRHGLQFGVYYSGGIDWHFHPTAAHVTHQSFHGTDRPNGADYARYAAQHLRDLIERYRPAVLWNDIEWPEAGKDFGPDGLGTIFEEYYRRRPDGVVNDRWHVPHHDFATSEYQHGKAAELEDAWENTRGVGLSFGYNQLEGTEHSIAGAEAARLLADVVSRGGKLLLNIGPRADGTLPEIQRQVLQALGRWMSVARRPLAGARPVEQAPLALDGQGWLRLVRTTTGAVVCLVDSQEPKGPERSSAAVRLVGEGALHPLQPAWGSVSRDRAAIEVHLAANRPGPALFVWEAS